MLYGVSFMWSLVCLCLQGNGHERDFMEEDKVYILDMYNRGIYPHDGFAKRKFCS